MLRKICSKELTTEEIVFKKGLNVILGDDSGHNSVGKTTSMKLINHVFGGNLVVDNEELKDQFPDLVVNFELQFDDESFYFSRSISQKKDIFVCDSDYSVVKSTEIGKYTSFLKSKYNIRDDSLSFRSAANFTSRIWDKNRPNATLLSDYGNKSEAVVILLKLFDWYGPISDIDDRIKQCSKETHASTTVLKRYGISDTRKQLSQIEEEIKILDPQIKQLMRELGSSNSNPYIPSAEEIQYQDEIRKANKELDQLATKRRRLASNYLGDDTRTKYLIEELVRFFPGIEQKHLTDIERFHHDISEILSEEIDNDIRICDLEINTVRKRIKDLEGKHLKSHTDSSLDMIKIKHLMSSMQKHEELRISKQELENLFAFKREKKSLEKSVSEMRKTIYQELEDLMNSELSKKCETIYGSNRSSPNFTITNKGSYHYMTPNDSGTGRTYADAIMFDQITLERSDAPYLIHDSYMFNHIEPNTIVKLLQNYNKTKQSFITVDSHTVFDPLNRELFKNQICLKLDAEHTLFNKKWNTKD